MKIRNLIKLIALSVVASALFVGCGGGSDSASSSPSTPSTPALSTTLNGTFVDAPVQGLSYKTPTQSGFTDANGQFKYVNGEDVTFKLGNLELGKGKGGAVMTPYTISESSDMTTNIALLLQNFDNDRTDSILNIAALKDYNFNDLNLSGTTTNMESKLATLLATGDFQTLRGGTDFGLINATAVKSAMDNYLENNSIEYDKKFTQAYLDNAVFYKSSDEYPQYMNKYVGGYIYFAGDEEGDMGWNSTFSTATSTYTLVDGIIDAHFDDGNHATFEITEVTDTYIKTLGKLVGTNTTREDLWYTDKETAIANTITVQYGFGSKTLKDRTVYLRVAGLDSIPTMTFKDGINTAEGTTYAQPFIIDNGILKVDESGRDGKTDNSSDRYQYYKVTAIDEFKITTCAADSVANVSAVPCTHDIAKLYYSLSDAQSEQDAALNTSLAGQ